jgi:hypothetical protein
LAVNALGRLGESLLASRGQSILAESAVPPSNQPAVLGQPCNRRAHQPFCKPKWRRKLNEAPESHNAAPRRYGVAEYRHEQRATPDGPLALEAPEKAACRCGDAGLHGRIVTHK